MAKRKSFIQGAVILGVAGLIIKALGAVFRIPLANIIGDEGMGYYQTAYPIYVLFLTLSTAGIPTAISKLVSERIAMNNPYEANRVFRVSFALLFGIGVFSAGILFFGAPVIVQILGNSGAKLAMMSIAPALLFVPLMAAYRGYFQGMQDMAPTASSQVIEQFFRVGAGLFMAVFFVNRGLDYAAAGASFGATAGAAAGLLGIIAIYAFRKKKIMEEVDRDKKRLSESNRRILGKILIIAIPITIGAAIMPIMNAIDVTIVMRRLQDAGLAKSAANSLYGQLTGMAGPLINFPQVLTQAIAMSLVPAIAAAYKQKDMAFLHKNVQLGVRTSMIIGLPCAFGLMALAEPIMLMIYPMQKASAINAAPSLVIMAFGVVFLSSVQTLTGVLQGVGKQNIPVRNLFIGAVFKVVITYVLTGISFINIRGAAIGTVVAYIVASSLNLYAVKKYVGVRFDLNLTVIKPVFSALVMAFSVYFCHRICYGLLGNTLATLISIMVGAGVYGILLLVTKSITNEEILLMPKGAKLVKLFGKLKR